jgi:hypothetical protein
VLPHGVVHPQQVGARAERRESGFDHGREQQPVVIAGRDRAGRFQRGDEISLRARVERSDQRASRAQQSLREKRRIDERLAAAGEVQVIRRRRIDRVVDRAPRQVGAGAARASLLRLVVAEL